MFNEGADVYHITMTEAEAANLRRDGIETMTFYSFLRKRVEQYSEKVLVNDYKSENPREINRSIAERSYDRQLQLYGYV